MFCLTYAHVYTLMMNFLNSACIGGIGWFTINCRLLFYYSIVQVHNVYTTNLQHILLTEPKIIRNTMHACMLNSCLFISVPICGLWCYMYISVLYTVCVFICIYLMCTVNHDLTVVVYIYIYIP